MSCVFLLLGRLLVSKGAEVECEDSKGRTPLQLAAAGNHASVVEWLLGKVPLLP